MNTIEEINKILDEIKPYPVKIVRLAKALRYAISVANTKQRDDHILSILRGETE